MQALGKISKKGHTFVFIFDKQKTIFVLPRQYCPRKGARKRVSQKMSIIAMKKFAYKAGRKKIEILPYYSDNLNFTMFFLKPNCIGINDNYFKRNMAGITEIKGSLLHELGHMCCKHRNTYSVSLISKQEFEAQLWAYKKAKKLGLLDVMRFLYNDIVAWAKTKQRGGIYTACKKASKKWIKKFKGQYCEKSL